jgi:Domain of unknown function (DUF4381)
MNDTDPLAQLRDIHTPMPVDWWPLAPGWWFLLVLSLALLIVICIWVLRRHRANAYRRTARAELAQHYHNWQQNGAGLAYLQSANDILKRTAMLSYKNSAVQGLSGSQWCEFLDQHRDGTDDTGFGNSSFESALYSNENLLADITSLHKLADRWLHKHQGEKC